MVILSGQYEGDIREGLKLFRDPFKFVMPEPAYWKYSDLIYHSGVPITMTVSYQNSHLAPINIMASALDMMGCADEKVLTGYLDAMLTITGIQEIYSEKQRFEQMFKTWESFLTNFKN
jgi:hypothetical protein